MFNFITSNLGPAWMDKNNDTYRQKNPGHVRTGYFMTWTNRQHMTDRQKDKAIHI